MEYKSKTQKKKNAQALQVLGEQLVQLSAEQIDDIDLPLEVHNAVKFAKKLKNHGALRRQMQYIGTLMLKVDPEPVKEALYHINQGNSKKAKAFQETERLREELIEGNKALEEEILTKCSDADRQKLSQLIRQAGKETINNKPPGAARALFRYLIKIRAVHSGVRAVQIRKD